MFLGHQASTIFHDHYIALTESLSDVSSVAKLLHGEEVISDTVLSELESTEGLVEQQKILLDAIREAVLINYINLQTFASVLEKFTDTVLLGESINRQYGKLLYAC